MPPGMIISLLTRKPLMLDVCFFFDSRCEPIFMQTGFWRVTSCDPRDHISHLIVGFFRSQVGSIPSGTWVDLLGQQGNWRQVCHCNLRGWVGAKHVGHLPSPTGRPGLRPEGAGHSVSSLGSRSGGQPSGSPPAPSTGFLVEIGQLWLYNWC